jgi:hypothetical protein
MMLRFGNQILGDKTGAAAPRFNLSPPPEIRWVASHPLSSTRLPATCGAHFPGYSKVSGTEHSKSPPSGRGRNAFGLFLKKEPPLPFFPNIDERRGLWSFQGPVFQPFREEHFLLGGFFVKIKRLTDHQTRSYHVYYFSQSNHLKGDSKWRGRKYFS